MSAWLVGESFSSPIKSIISAHGPLDKLTDKRAGRVLIVDDDYSLRRVLHTTLFSGGFDVNEAAGGDEVSGFRKRRAS